MIGFAPLNPSNVLIASTSAGCYVASAGGKSPKLGQHNAEIFGRLGFSKKELDELHAKRVL